jgi:1,4-dihydroxy-6-naphthoate synthase
MTAVSDTEKTTSSAAAVREITVAHSPDSDDAFMFYALATPRACVSPTRFATSRRSTRKRKKASMMSARFLSTPIPTCRTNTH